MANTKKAASADTKETAAKTAPAAAETTAKADEKKPAAKRGRKPAAAKTENKPAASKPGRKPAASKSAAKPGRKPAAAKTETASAKRGAKKKGLSYDDILTAARKKILAADITKIKYPIAANVELTGNFIENEDSDNKNIFYIYIDPDKEDIAVEPYRYNDYHVSINADAEELLNVLKSKKNIYDALADGSVHIHGNTKKSILLIQAAF